MKTSLIMAAGLLTAMALPLFAGGAKEDPLRGTWYGGSSVPDHAGFKYEYTFIPTGADRWYALADGVYSPVNLGVAIATRWTGEVVRSGATYEIRLLSLSTTTADSPPKELPTAQVVRGHLSFNGSGEVTITYDLWGLYKWGQTPFVEQPAVWNLKPGDPPIVERINRMNTEVEFSGSADRL